MYSMYVSLFLCHSYVHHFKLLSLSYVLFLFFLFNLSSCFRIMLSLNSRYNVLVEVYVQWLDVFLCGVVPRLCRCISLWRCPSTLHVACVCLWLVVITRPGGPLLHLRYVRPEKLISHISPHRASRETKCP